MEGHILLKALLTAAQNDLCVSNIGKFFLIQHSPWKQPALKNRGDVCNTCKVIEKSLSTNCHTNATP